MQLRDLPIHKKFPLRSGAGGEWGEGGSQRWVGGWGGGGRNTLSKVSLAGHGRGGGTAVHMITALALLN